MKTDMGENICNTKLCLVLQCDLQRPYLHSSEYTRVNVIQLGLLEQLLIHSYKKKKILWAGFWASLFIYKMSLVPETVPGT